MQSKYEKLQADCKKKDGSSAGNLSILLERAVCEEVDELEAAHKREYTRRPRLTSKLRSQWLNEAEDTIANWVEKFRYPNKYEAENSGGWSLPRSSMMPRDVLSYRRGIITAWALTRMLYKER